jgi:tripartite-type tricarboxylate transporter receptor subunit TctC
MNRRNVLLGCLGASLFTKSYAKNIDLTFVVPSSPGGSSDISSRLLASSLEAQLKITIMNRPSGQGVEGSMFVLRSNPNSGVLLVGGPNGLFFSPARENVPYNSDSFEPICMFSMASFAIVSKTESFKDIDDLLKISTSRNLNIGFSQSDVGYLISRLGQITGSRLNTIAYKGGGDLVRDIHSGTVDAGILSIASVAGSVQSGSLKLLAHTQDSGSVRIYPNVPRLADVISSNDSSLMTYHWHGLYAPKGISRDTFNHIQNMVSNICRDSKFISDHETRGMTSRFMDARELRDHHDKLSYYMIGYTQWLREYL